MNSFIIISVLFGSLISVYDAAIVPGNPFSSTDLMSTDCNGSFYIPYADASFDLIINHESVFEEDDEIYIGAYSSSGKLSGFKELSLGVNTALAVFIDNDGEGGMETGEEVKYVISLNGVVYLAEVEYSLGNGNIVCNGLQTISKIVASNSPFGVKERTSCNMSILIPGDINIDFDGLNQFSAPAEIYFDESNILNIPDGSLWLGGFNEIDELVGVTQLIPGAPFNFITVWGADDNETNGLLVGESISWKLNYNGATLEADITYLDNDNDSAVYTCNGLNRITSITSSNRPWDPVTPTDCNLTLLLPNDMQVTVLDEPLIHGDYFWLLATTANDLVIGEVRVVVGETTAMPIWGAEEGKENGLQAGDEINLKIYYNGEFIAAYGDFATLTNNYSCNGLAELNSLSAYNTLTQDIPIKNGWNLWSIYLNPDLENVYEIVDLIKSNIIIVKDEMGSVYWPAWDLEQIGPLTHGRGYQMKLTNLQDDHFQVFGSLHTSPVQITLNQGWSIIGCLIRDEGVDMSNIFNEIAGDLVIVKDEEGSVYWPAWNYNNIGNIIPGKGYQIKMENSVVFTYPEEYL